MAEIYPIRNLLAATRRMPAGCLKVAININIQALQDTLSLLNEAMLLQAVEAISHARHVFLAGLGTSALVAQDACQRLLELRIHSSACSDAGALASIAASVGPDDVLFCISYDGAGRYIAEALETAGRRRAPTITLTSAPRSVAAQLSEIVLVSAARRAPGAAESAVAREAQLAVFDVICAAVAFRQKTQKVAHRASAAGGRR